MNNFLRKLLIAIFVIGISPTLLLSDNIPKKLQGFWSGNSCNFAFERYALFIGQGGYLYEDKSDVEFNFAKASEVNEWIKLTNKDSNQRFTYYYKVEEKKLLERYPPEDWDGKDMSFLSAQTSKDTIYFKCEKKDPLIESKYGELLSFLNSPAVKVCNENTKDQDGCLVNAFKFLDVNGDKELHPAEINRGFRTFSLIAVLLNNNIENYDNKNVVFGIYLAAIPFIPLITNSLMANIDYNGSRSLSLEEISKDRSDLFSAILSAKDGVLKDLETVPEMLEKITPFLRGLGGLI